MKEIYPSYLTKLTSAVHFEKIESNAGCSKFNYNAGDNGYEVNDSEDSLTSEPYDKSEREEKKASDATIIKDLVNEMGVTAETFYFLRFLEWHAVPWFDDKKYPKYYFYTISDHFQPF